jgi:hypothetical protein
MYTVETLPQTGISVIRKDRNGSPIVYIWKTLIRNKINILKLILLRFNIHCILILRSITPRNERKTIYFGLNPFAVHGADDPNLNEEVSSFNLEWSPYIDGEYRIYLTRLNLYDEAAKHG